MKLFAISSAFKCHQRATKKVSDKQHMRFISLSLLQ